MTSDSKTLSVAAALTAAAEAIAIKATIANTFALLENILQGGASEASKVGNECDSEWALSQHKTTKMCRESGEIWETLFAQVGCGIFEAAPVHVFG